MADFNNGQAIYVDTAKIQDLIGELEIEINNIVSAIKNYPAQAQSFGQSSFRPIIERNLKGISDAYSESIIPTLNQMLEDIKAVKQTYSNAGTKIYNT